MSPRSERGTIALTFFCVAVAVSGILPLWLDEIIQLVRTRNTTAAGLLHALPGQPGAAPLGYLTQQLFLNIFGYSVRIARLPSALCAAGTVWLTSLLAREFNLKQPWIAAAIFACFPLLLRYGSEGRPYSEALFFATLATVLFLQRRMALSGIALALAVYSQPYAIFVGVAHILWAAVYKERKLAIQASIAGVAAVAAFLPWYLWTKTAWVSGIHEADVHFAWSIKTPLMLFRELAGANYWGSGILLILSLIALPLRKPVALLLILIFTTISLALAADKVFDYFIATRQMIWVLPAVAVLASLGLEKNPRIGASLAALLVLVCIAQSFRYFTQPKENWDLAAERISAETARGACLTVVPAEERETLAFFRPDLVKSACDGPTMALALTPYATATQRAAAQTDLKLRGYDPRIVYEAGKTRIEIYARIR